MITLETLAWAGVVLLNCLIYFIGGYYIATGRTLFSFGGGVLTVVMAIFLSLFMLIATGTLK